MLLSRALAPACLLPVDFATRIVDPREALVPCDLRVGKAKIEEVAAAGALAPRPGEAVHDLAGRLVLPALADAHTHLDKTHTIGRIPNPGGTWLGALRALGGSREHWRPDDIHRRADFALRTAYARGTAAMRTHLDHGPNLYRESWEALVALRAKWSGRLALQLVPMAGVAEAAFGQDEAMAADAAGMGAAALGGMPVMSPSLDRELDHLLDVAAAHGLPLDLHVDESGNASAEVLRAVADAVVRRKFPLPVNCGHACSLSRQHPAHAADTLSRVKGAGISLVALPSCNLHLQDRDTHPSGRPATPRWRGITLVHEALDADIPLAVASDNVRDAFYAFGDYDLIDTLARALDIAHLDSRLAQAPSLITSTPAATMGLPHHGRLVPGAPAELAITVARSLDALFCRPGAPRERVSGESLWTPVLPDYEELGSPPGP